VQRVYGPDTALPVLEAAARRGVAVGFYGGAPARLERLVEAVRTRFSGIQMAYAWSPPFRRLTSQEDDQVVGAINGSVARILFVGLGTPEQEYWMAAHRGRVQAVMCSASARRTISSPAPSLRRPAG
jgi:N-acetylglucosaminyldiphosphoundecaprenol N-acetyl-beta-D-mannosaminyltransferase